MANASPDLFIEAVLAFQQTAIKAAIESGEPCPASGLLVVAQTGPVRRPERCLCLRDQWKWLKAGRDFRVLIQLRHRPTAARL